jgi:methyl-accepting chemotaxis protein
LSVNIKILTAVTVAALVALLVGITGLSALSDSSAAAQRIYTANVAGVEAAGQVRAVVTQGRVDAANQALSTDPVSVKQFTDAFTDDIRSFETAMAAYRAGGPAVDASTLDELTTQWEKYVTVVQTKMMPVGVRNDAAAWSKIRDTEAIPIVKTIYRHLDAVAAAEKADAAKSAAAADAGYRSSRTISILLLVGGLVIALVAGGIVARRIVGSLSRVKDVCDSLAAGDLTRTTGLTSRDEPGRMGRSLDTAMASLRETITTIDGSASSLASASEQMTGTVGQIANSAHAASEQSQAVSAAADEISRSVDTVSAGSEQMGASIREISQNASEAAHVAAEAVDLAASTSTTMNKLGESSAEIGNVIKVITSIAEQTNLLALNATIEAARAGEMGKGFAVVASEVKDLAQETARATEDISHRVETIQADTEGAVLAIEKISEVIARISDFQTTIASAVEEQTATTAEMNRSVAEAANGTGSIAQSITGVAQASQDTSHGVAQTQQAIADLARMSTDLSSLVARFRV